MNSIQFFHYLSKKKNYKKFYVDEKIKYKRKVEFWIFKWVIENC